jgi:hypothetical protein
VSVIPFGSFALLLIAKIAVKGAGLAAKKVDQLALILGGVGVFWLFIILDDLAILASCSVKCP